jgi:tetratricopeptide (TPR) repeat protein
VRLEIMIELSEALQGTGALGEAQRVLDEAAAEAEAAGDNRVRARANVEAAFTQLHTWEGPLDLFVPLSEEAAAVFEATGDDVGLSRALMLHAYITFIRCRLAETEEILDRAIEHAQRADSRRLVADLLHVRARAALRGPTTVTAAMEWCEAARELNAGDLGLDAFVRGELAVLEAMRGRFDEARTLSAEAERILLDLGRTLALAFVRADAGAVELLAGNAGTASAILRSACDTLVEIGERGNLSTYAALLAEALADQGDDDGADKYALLSEDTALREDIQSQVLWRNARARILCRAGDLVDARVLADESVALAEQTDDLNLTGDALVALGGVLAAEEDPAQASKAYHRAVELYERKGNVTSAARARELAQDPAVRT